MKSILSLITIVVLFMCACGSASDSSSQLSDVNKAAEKTKPQQQRVAPDYRYPSEKHLTNVKQLTYGGNNAEAYFSFDDKQVVMQVENQAAGIECDQIYWSDIPTRSRDSLNLKLVSTGTGRTTCSYFMPGNEQIIFASTHLGDENCPPTPDRKKIKKYVWPIYNTYEIFTANKDGSNLKQWTDNNFYDAEATVSPDGQKIVFTSTRNGDLDLYTMNIDGSDIRQITSELGYDGGAFFSPDSKKLVFRASRPKTREAVIEYKSLLKQGLVAPTDMELYVADADGKNLKKITDLGRANWAPYFHPSGEKIIFSSNHHTEGGFPFNLFMINMDGSGLEQITFDKAFDAFPMFSFDGSKLLFSSNRNNGGNRDTNVFIADWTD